MATHYDLLGVEPGASLAAIKRAYYDKARVFHPDAHASAPVAMRLEAELAMRDLNEAWNTLRAARSRRAYDRALADEHPSAAGSRNHPSRRRRAAGDGHQPARRPLAIGTGFRYWLGTSGAGLATADGKPRLNLAVDKTADLAPLQALAPNGLWALHAQGSEVDDAQLRHLARLRGLTFLDLSGTTISDAGLVHLQGLANLEVLMLWDTAVTDEGLFLLRHLTALRQLGLGNTIVGDAGLPHLFALRGLRLLQLWGTQVTGHGLAYLAGFPELEALTLPWRIRGRERRRLRRALPHTTIA